MHKLSADEAGGRGASERLLHTLILMIPFPVEPTSPCTMTGECILSHITDYTQVRDQL